MFKLSKLGFLLFLSGGGLINDGDEGSEPWNVSAPVLRLSARLFKFLVLRGPGDVMGLSSLSCNRMGGASAIFKFWKLSKPKDDPENEERGRSVMGDSGEELGEGSDNEDESTVDIVVVGEESVESDACVEVLSWC